MRTKLCLAILLACSVLAAEDLEKAQKKALEAQVKTMTKQAEQLEKSGQLAEALRVAGDMFEGRVRLRAEMLRSILPLVVFVGVAMVALFALVAMYSPMISLIQGLS